ncbi:hypothetical protein QU845_24765, partial [Escherichia coli]|nr:hypothetical protein [Escherichia coli]
VPIARSIYRLEKSLKTETNQHRQNIGRNSKASWLEKLSLTKTTISTLYFFDYFNISLVQFKFFLKQLVTFSRTALINVCARRT